ncbi:DUF3592 domain-containing protein [Streptomyces aurantiacus]|uniref:DUF3592 domain-containing protein n=1 Tax=Streptomyces aurantiacus JA 4570 TaxID=1286094 RepID=S3ZZS6_9ACTN|nr:DUF3592 domain-containing protein [Streptomyces aurantiacus]EPH43955.1 hypothetical protein STRAU_2994 [Streptomyces aurantiacus JA 4570]
MSRGLKLGWLAALLIVVGSIVVTLFGYSGHSRVTRLYQQGVTVEGEAVEVTTDGRGRTSGITVRYRPTGRAPVTAELPTTPKLPRAVEGRPIEVIYDSEDPDDVLSTAQLHAVQPDWNPLSVLGFGVMGAGLVVVVMAARRPRSR